MYRYAKCRKLWQTMGLAGLWRLLRLLPVLLGLSLAASSAVVAAEKPDKGGTIIWAVHESMPSFDLHYETTYIVSAAPRARSTTAW